LGLEIARAIFEAAGGSFHVARSAASLGVEVGILQKRGR